jgi:pimeloyl-ACP methyl ester carboxylesterase
MRRPGIAASLVIVTALVSASCQSTAGNAQQNPIANNKTGESPARYVQIGNGQQLYLECYGTGPLTVIFESGLRTRGDNWTRSDVLSHGGTPVLLQAAKFSRACTYDRPGTTLNIGEVSRSSTSPMPRTAQDVVEDLHTLLHAASLRSPFVLVGHSFGGLFVRLYAKRYPEEVGGLVLVDPLAEQIRPLLKPLNWATLIQLNSGPLSGFENYSALETIDFDKSFDQMIEASRHSDIKKIPVIVLVRGKSVELPASAQPNYGSILEPAWRKSEEQLAAAIPNAELVIAKNSGHYIQWDEPDLVVKAIRDVLAVRTH